MGTIFKKITSIFESEKSERAQAQSEENKAIPKFGEFSIIKESVNRSTQGFFYSTPFITYSDNDNKTKFEVGLREFAIMSALSGKNLLLRGGTGIGKTSFSKSFLNGVFGQNYAVLQVDVSLDESKYINVNFNEMKKGKKLSDSMIETKLITAPAVIFDEYNRAVGLQTSLIQGWLANDEIIVQGNKRFIPGKTLKDGSNYQFKIATINEGIEYVNTQEIDLASRDRFAIELNMDNFPMTDNDKRDLLSRIDFAEHEKKHFEDNQNKRLLRSEIISKAFFDLYFKIRDIEISGEVQEFMVYLQRLDNCYKSPLGTKKSFMDFNESVCAGCNATNLNNGLCSNIHTVSPRTIANTVALAKALAGYRIYNTLNHDNHKAKVLLEDVQAVLPFTVSVNKLGLSKKWIEWSKNETGNVEYTAINTVVKIIIERFKQDFGDIGELILKENNNIKLSEEEKAKIRNTIMKNPWSRPREDIIKTYEFIKNSSKF
ncbi:hypothetical protein M1141_00520 [Candidatus Marsarchaeota archaeon]|nr:hypothetical protein [Candidatus Marsarchaeota archaeon]